MAYYKIADFIIEINTSEELYIKDRFKLAPLLWNLLPDISVDVTADDTKVFSSSTRELCSQEYLERIAACNRVAFELPKHGAVLLHGSAVYTGGRAIVFIADSGVGKTTHTRLWQQYLGDRMIIINGDKPIVRMRDGKPIIYSSPWTGKEGDESDIVARLTDICVLTRSENNYTTQIEPAECIDEFLRQLLHPTDPIAALAMLDTADKILSSVNCWRIGCNISPEAAETAYNAIFSVPAPDTAAGIRAADDK